jgi:hypothetical protein
MDKYKLPHSKQSKSPKSDAFPFKNPTNATLIYSLSTTFNQK